MKQLNVKTNGAFGDGKHDDTNAIIKSINDAKAQKIPQVYFPEGVYLIAGEGLNTGIIPLRNGVSLMGAGKYNTKILLSGGRYNPASIFYQPWWDEPSIDNLSVSQLNLDGNMANQTFNSVMGAQGNDFQYCHGLTLSNGVNPTITNCKFEGFRGDGLVFGDAFQTNYPSPDGSLRIVRNISVGFCEFTNIYREGILVCCADYGRVFNCYFHGNGFGVAGIDLERHTMKEQVTNISVFNNDFLFSDGYGPAEREGNPARFRRAVSMGFFYEGYQDGIPDGKASGNKVYSNNISQGQIDCWGHTFVSIYNNKMYSDLEDLSGIMYISPNLIKAADPNGHTVNLDGLTISGNQLTSHMKDAAVSVQGYRNPIIINNTIKSALDQPIQLANCASDLSSNIITGY